MSETPLDISEVDVDTPNIARMYDYFLGGSTNFAVDRRASEELLRAFPGNTEWAHINRAFLGRAVRELCQHGVDQFLDLGSGIPTKGNVHEIAHHEDPAARVAYVDCEPVAVHHSRQMLKGDSHATVTHADIREPWSVLHADGVARLLDFTRPVAVLAVAILDIIDTEDAAGLMAAYRDVCVSGSALVISHGAPLDLQQDEATAAREVFHGTTTPHMQVRSREEIAALFTGYDMLEPGLVPSARWRPATPVSDEQAARSNGYAAVGILP